MAVSKRLRFEVMRRDNHACRYCGGKAPDVVLVVDHVVAKTLGGTDDPSNLVTACEDCNNGKSSVPADAPTVAAIRHDAIRWSRAMLRASLDRETEREVLLDSFAYLDDIWESWTRSGDGQWPPRPTDWRNSVETFITLGLSCNELEYLIEVAMRSTATFPKKWRYFCGCCWKAITELQETARQMIEEGRI